MPAWGLIAGGIGLLQGAVSSQKKFKGYGEMNRLIGEYGDSSRGIEYFQRLAQDSGPSLDNLKSLAAATGGSQAAAIAQSNDMRIQSGDQALNAFGRYRQGIEGLRANLISTKAGMKQADFNSRREAMTSLGNQVASAGFGYFANQQGLKQGQSFLNGMNFSGTANPAGNAIAGMNNGMTPQFNQSMMNSYNAVFKPKTNFLNPNGSMYQGFGISNRDVNNR